MNEVLKDVEKRMIGAVEACKTELARLRTGRASLAILDGITVDYYGSATPLNQVASLSVPEPTTILVAPWEPSILAEIEKALLKSQLGLTPNNDGKVVRLHIPPLTEERRKELVKLAQDNGEEARNAIRQVRRETVGIANESGQVQRPQRHPPGAPRRKRPDQEAGEGQEDLRGSDARRPRQRAEAHRYLLREDRGADREQEEGDPRDLSRRRWLT